jgi:hypothetical protein
MGELISNIVVKPSEPLQFGVADHDTILVAPIPGRLRLPYLLQKLWKVE